MEALRRSIVGELPPDATRHRVEETIARLKLNDPECLAARGQFYDLYVQGELGWSLFSSWCPFIAKEMVRQGVVPAELP